MRSSVGRGRVFHESWELVDEDSAEPQEWMESEPYWGSRSESIRFDCGWRGSECVSATHALSIFSNSSEDCDVGSVQRSGRVMVVNGSLDWVVCCDLVDTVEAFWVPICSLFSSSVRVSGDMASLRTSRGVFGHPGSFTIRQRFIEGIFLDAGGSVCVLVGNVLVNWVIDKICGLHRSCVVDQ